MKVKENENERIFLLKLKKCKVEGEEDKGIKNEREYIKKARHKKRGL